MGRRVICGFRNLDKHHLDKQYAAATIKPRYCDPSLSSLPRCWMAKPQPKKSKPRLNLEALKEGMPAVTPAMGEMMAEAAAVCLEHQTQTCGASFSVTGKWRRTFE